MPCVRCCRRTKTLARNTLGQAIYRQKTLTRIPRRASSKAIFSHSPFHSSLSDKTCRYSNTSASVCTTYHQISQCRVTFAATAGGNIIFCDCGAIFKNRQKSRIHDVRHNKNKPAKNVQSMSRRRRFPKKVCAKTTAGFENYNTRSLANRLCSTSGVKVVVTLNQN